MNRATVISMVQDLTEHKADQRLDFDNLFNLRLVKFIQEKPFWWRKKIFSFTTAPGVPLYDFANLQPSGSAISVSGGSRTAGIVTANTSGLPIDLVLDGQVVIANASDPTFNGGPFPVTAIVGNNFNYNQGGGADVALGTETATVYHAPVSLASDLESFIKVELWLNGLKFGVLEPNFDIEDISDQQESATPGPPSTYCVEPGTLTTMRLMSRPDRVYKVKSSYWACPQPADDYSDNAIPLIPAMYHHALVSGLKMDVTGFLYGEKSNLYVVSQGEYQESIQKAVARQDFSNQKMVQYIISDEAVASTPGN